MPPKSNTNITLRDVTDSDLEIFFRYEQEPEAVQMAAFTAKDPSDRTAFDAHWAKIMADDKVLIKTIVWEGKVVGDISSFIMFDELEVSYWIGMEFWGRGIATSALAEFLKVQTERPIHARSAKDNVGSIRVLEKCGFVQTAEERGFANARGKEIAELVFELE